MPASSPEPKWFVAELVEELSIGRRPTRRIHINTCLIRASSAEAAYRKALALGNTSNDSYTNTDGEAVRVIFRGLRELLPVYETLGDGCELFYEVVDRAAEGQAKALVRQKRRLGAFARAEGRR